jgi:glutamyl-tRNA reductase
MERYHILALTHKEVRIEEIGKYNIAEEQWAERLGKLKSDFHGIEELMLLSTCNRLEFFFKAPATFGDSASDLFAFFTSAYPQLSDEDCLWVARNCKHYRGADAVSHLLEVASSLNSLVVGEREIITQVRKSYEKCRDLGLTGDSIRLAVQHAIVSAKEVFTKTGISTRPVSVVSLAYRKLIESGIPKDARFLFIGAGQTNTLMAKFLLKHGYSNFRVFNRSIERAEQLGSELKSPYFKLSELSEHGRGFDVIITCTAASEHIIHSDIYQSILEGDQRRKMVIDLAVPHDFSPEVVQNFNIRFIDVSELQQLAESNLLERKTELGACQEILNARMEEFHQLFRVRQIELAMSAVPKELRTIRHQAFNNVFNKDIEQLDEQSREVMEKIIDYMEKKFIAVPMKLTKALVERDFA